MNQYYDLFNQIEKPPIVLCNPDKSEIAVISRICYDTTLKLRYNAVSEIETLLPSKVDGQTIDFYFQVLGKRLLYVKDVAYFVITDVEEIIENDVPVKKIKGKSLEFELSFKKLFVFDGTFYFYNPNDPNRSMMNVILNYIPNWSIGTIDTSLMNRARTFKIGDTTIYNFLMSTASSAYGCVFTFDTINRTISATKIENVVEDTDIFITMDNLIKSVELKEISDEIVTKMYVYGGGDLDIRTVNPLGENAIYNFDYYKTTEWMSQDLIDAISAWESVVSSNQVAYADLLTVLKNQYAQLLVLQTQLDALKEELKTLELQQKVLIQNKQTITAQYRKLVQEIDAKKSYIVLKQAEVTAKQVEIDETTNSLKAINNIVALDSNFTQSQLLTLNSFMYENTWQNENIVQLDSDTPEQVQDLSQNLYNQAVEVLSRVSQPRYEFDVDMVNFIFLKEYLPFTQQLEMGSKVYVKTDDYLFSVVLLEIELNYDKPEDFSMTFGNRLRLDGSGFVYSDLFGQVVKTGTSVSFDSVAWSNWTDSYKADVSSFIENSLDATKNALINSTDQEIIIDGVGLRGRQLSNGNYDDRQVWLTSNLLAFTNDSWNSVETALGEVTLFDPDGNPNGATAFGLLANAVYGDMITGSTLRIKNTTSGGSFSLDDRGAKLLNCDLEIRNDKNSIVLNPADGIRIRNISGTTSKDVFYVDTSGNVTLDGTIIAKSGQIGNWKISDSGLEYSEGGELLNYIRPKTLKLADGVFNISRVNGVPLINLGALRIVKEGGVYNSYFDGNIYARNLDDYKPNTDSGLKSSKLAPQTNIPMASGGGLNWGGKTISESGTWIEISGGSNGGVLLGNGLSDGVTVTPGTTVVRTNRFSIDVVDIVVPQGSIAYDGTVDLTTATTLYFSGGLLYDVA